MGEDTNCTTSNSELQQKHSVMMCHVKKKNFWACSFGQACDVLFLARKQLLAVVPKNVIPYLQYFNLLLEFPVKCSQ